MSKIIEINGRSVNVIDSIYDLVKGIDFNNTQTTTRPRRVPFVDAVYPLDDDRCSTNPDDFILFQDGKFGVDPAEFDPAKGLKFIWVYFQGCDWELETYVYDEAMEDPVYLIFTKAAIKPEYYTDGKVYETKEYAETMIKFNDNDDPCEPVSLAFEKPFDNAKALAIALEQIAEDLKLGETKGEIPVKWHLQKQ